MSKKENEKLSCEEKGVLFAHRTVKKIGQENDMELRSKLEHAHNKSCKPDHDSDEEVDEEEDEK